MLFQDGKAKGDLVMVLIMVVRVMMLVAVTKARGGGGGGKLTQVPLPGDNEDDNGDDGGEIVSKNVNSHC